MLADMLLEELIKQLLILIQALIDPIPKRELP